MNLPNESIDPSIQMVLAHLPPSPVRNPQVASRGRAQFLTEAESLRQAISPRPILRQRSWLNLFQRKERLSMSTVAMVLLLISLALGGSGAAVYAAQDAMPNDPLYAIKLATEDARINAEDNVQTRAALELDFADRRLQEIAVMANRGVVPPDAVMARQQSQIEMALHEAAGMNDAAMNQTLLGAQTMLREQLRIVDMTRTYASDQVAPVLDRVRERLQIQLELTDLGLRDPQLFRAQIRQTTREQSQQRQQEHPPTAQPKPTTAPAEPTAVQRQ